MNKNRVMIMGLTDEVGVESVDLEVKDGDA
jgi:hypothetical protein